MTTNLGNILVRFFHPNKDLSFISSLLGMPCVRSWVAGSPRETPTGAPLSGTFKESYWVARLEYPSETGFRGQLIYAIDRLEGAEKSLSEFRLTGGKSEIYLQLQGSINNGDVIDPYLLNRMSQLEIHLLIEVFPDM